MKRYTYILAMLLVLCMTVSVFAACQNGPENETESTAVDTTVDDDSSEVTTDDATDESETESTAAETTRPAQESVADPDDESQSNDESESVTTPEAEAETVVYLTFSGTGYTSSVEGAVTVSDSIFLISEPGTYELSGELTNGQIRVQVDKTEDVTLVLNNFKAHCSFSAPLYIVSADEATIRMPEGTVNTFTDSNRYEHSFDVKPNACIYSSDDLIIRGKGSLNVTSLWNNGIGCKNDLVLRTGSFTVSAVKNAIKGNDSVTVENGATVTVLDGNDGIKTDNALDAGKGFILICEESQVSITCDKDALQATQNITVEAGSLVKYDCGTPTQCDGTTNIADGTLVPLS